MHLRDGISPFKAVRFCARSPSGNGEEPHIVLTLLHVSASLGDLYGRSLSVSYGDFAKIVLPCGFSR